MDGLTPEATVPPTPSPPAGPHRCNPPDMTPKSQKPDPKPCNVSRPEPRDLIVEKTETWDKEMS